MITIRVYRKAIENANFNRDFFNFIHSIIIIASNIRFPADEYIELSFSYKNFNKTNRRKLADWIRFFNGCFRLIDGKLAIYVSNITLGPFQKQWIENLRKYPERKCIGQLGYKLGQKSYAACTLGEGLLTKFKLRKKKFPFSDHGNLYSEDSFQGIEDYQEYGLIYRTGDFRRFSDIKGKCSLSALNDAGNFNEGGTYSWTEIADLMEQNPEKIFVESI